MVSNTIIERDEYIDIVNNANDLIQSVGPNGEIRYTNNAWVTALEYSQDDLAGMTIFDIVHPEDRAHCQQALDSVASGGADVRLVRTRFIAKDGHIVWVEGNVSAQMKDGVFQHTTGIFRDITRLVGDEKTLSLSDAILHSIHDGLIAMDLDFIVTYWNEVSAEIFGIEAPEAEGRFIGDLMKMEEAFPEQNQRRLETLLKEGRNDEEQVYITPQGKIWVDVHMQEIVQNDKRVGWVTLLSDITERKKIEQKLQNVNEQLVNQNSILKTQTKMLRDQKQELMHKTEEVEYANKMKSEFLASMSHELRTPLNAIIGFSELLRDGVTGDINEEQKECLGDIVNSGHHLLSLINDVLDLSKVEAGKMEFIPAAISIDDIVRESVQTVKSLADKKCHCVSIDIDSDIPAIFADKSRLRQVIINLLSNAIKFTPDNGCIDISATDDGAFCRVRVQDNGVGLKEEDHEKIFEVFTQAEAIDNTLQKGTGLGLALTRQFIEAMGGKIWVESEPGNGSNFIFTIPFSENDSDAEDTDGTDRGEQTMGPMAQNEKKSAVIIIDDDIQSRKITKALLRQSEIDVKEAAGASEGLKYIAETKPDLVVLDILMPEKDGWYVLQQLKGDPETASIPVMVVSAEDENVLASSLGAAACFTKPVDRTAFLRSVSMLCAEHKEQTGD